MRFFRSWTRSPGVTLGIIVSAGVGVAVATMGITLPVNALFPPVPYAVGSRLVEFQETGIAPAKYASSENQQHRVSRAVVAALRERPDVFEAVVAYEESVPLPFEDRPGTSTLGAGVPYDLFPRLGIKPVVGRLFRPDEDQPGHGQVLILSYREWQSQFGGDSSVVGRVLRTDPGYGAGDYTIVGILDSTTVFPPQWSTSFYIPLGSRGMDRWRRASFVTALAIVRSGVSRASVQTAADLAAERSGPEDRAELAALDRTYVSPRGPVRVHVATFRRPPVRDSSEWTGAIMLAALGLTILAVAALNVASLALARMVRRRGELAVRAALGASRRRLITMLIAETGAVALVGAGLGAAMAAGLFTFARAILGIQFASYVPPNWRIVPIAACVALLAALAAVAWPAIQLGRTDLNAILKTGQGSSRTAGAGFKRVVALQVALTSALCVCAVAFVVAVGRYGRVDRGFNPAGAIVLRIVAPADAATRPAALQSAIDVVVAIPGVQVAAAGATPVSGGFTLNSGAASAPGENVRGLHTVMPVTGGYFESMGIPLLAGRPISATDDRQNRHIAVISLSMAKSLWPAQSAVGRQLYLGDYPATATPYEVVGIVRDLTMPFPRALPQIFVPYSTRLDRTTSIVARVAGNTDAALRAAVAVLTARRLAVQVLGSSSMIAAVRRGAQMQIASAVVLSALAIVGLAMAAAGLFGVVAYTTGQRAREFGVRLALGATPGKLIAFVLRDAASPVVTGLGLGLAGGIAATALMQSMLLGVSPVDGGVLSAVGVIVLLVALAASLHPAVRASGIDPVSSLRSD